MIQVVQDLRGQLSSRRVAGFVGLGMMAGCGVASFLGHSVGDHMLDVVTTFTTLCFGFATADHFSAQDKPNAPPPA